jgi:hypothetical protein
VGCGLLIKVLVSGVRVTNQSGVRVTNQSACSGTFLVLKDDGVVMYDAYQRKYSKTRLYRPHIKRILAYSGWVFEILVLLYWFYYKIPRI